MEANYLFLEQFWLEFLSQIFGLYIISVKNIVHLNVALVKVRLIAHRIPEILPEIFDYHNLDAFL